MGIDTMLFAADLPAATYTAGDVIEFTLLDGPLAVRPGLGQPVLKDIVTGAIHSGSGRVVPCYFKIQNSNWIDPILNNYSCLLDVTAMTDDSTGVQTGNDCPLVVNSTFTVQAVVTSTVTTTAVNSLFAAIDIQYPTVGAIVDPSAEVGTPASLNYVITPGVVAVGSMTSGVFGGASVDMFKPDCRYLLQKISAYVASSSSYVGFISISGGASMGGLKRIIPFNTASASMCKKIRYATVETKGPFELKALVLGTNANGFGIIADYVKR